MSESKNTFPSGADALHIPVVELYFILCSELREYHTEVENAVVAAVEEQIYKKKYNQSTVTQSTVLFET